MIETANPRKNPYSSAQIRCNRLILQTHSAEDNINISHVVI